MFHDTVRVQDAVFESGQEGLAVVGHPVRVLARLHGAERSSRPMYSFPTLSSRCTAMRCFSLRTAISACGYVAYVLRTLRLSQEILSSPGHPHLLRTIFSAPV